MEKHQTYFILLDALKESGCPVCTVLQNKVHKFMDDFLYEQINDPQVRRDIRAAFGFCNPHAWQLQKFGDALGMSLIYEDLLNALQEKIEQPEGFLNKHFFKYHHYGINKKICPVCQHSSEIEQRYVSSFIEYFSGVEFNSYWKSSFGLCLRHLIKALNDCQDKKIIEELKDVERQKWSVLRQELSEFKRKSDYRFNQEGFAQEGDAWTRAIEKFSGKEGIV